MIEAAFYREAGKRSDALAIGSGIWRELHGKVENRPIVHDPGKVPDRDQRADVDRGDRAAASERRLTGHRPTANHRSRQPPVVAGQRDSRVVRSEDVRKRDVDARDLPAGAGRERIRVLEEARA